MRPGIIPDRSPKRPRHRDQAGFTLIELVVVIVIVGILASFAVMSLNRTEPDGVTVCRADAQRWLDRQVVTAAQRDETVYIGRRNDTLDSFVLAVAPTVAGASTSPAATPSETAGVTRTVLDTLQWATGCRVDSRSDAGDSLHLPASDPRRDALLAVTSQGQWRAPSGAPELSLRGRHGRTQTLSLADEPGASSP
ncbi:prepilin-type N-terminal cleavage/methylation domain-containing protein [Halothiobacillus diazotrophicus]|uniref:prepilin-type N-terminal cleavage/methylation domain-containing protein n=1 Tax=Halothiobacillus diazotrophicus TaxID=1860122 RepID=UPI0018D2DB2C|nr:prepilin-type N-terminal cleavage/methylation domain-containing protein [Halothiobacillus diazotrophicus]